MVVVVVVGVVVVPHFVSSRVISLSSPASKTSRPVQEARLGPQVVQAVVPALKRPAPHGAHFVSSDVFCEPLPAMKYSPAPHVERLGWQALVESQVVTVVVASAVVVAVGEGEGEGEGEGSPLNVPSAQARHPPPLLRSSPAGQAVGGVAHRGPEKPPEHAWHAPGLAPTRYWLAVQTMFGMALHWNPLVVPPQEPERCWPGGQSTRSHVLHVPGLDPARYWSRGQSTLGVGVGGGGVGDGGGDGVVGGGGGGSWS